MTGNEVEDRGRFSVFSPCLAEDYAYNDIGSNKTSLQIQTHTIVADNYDIAYTYFYDEEGNIDSFIDYGNYTGYKYDSQNQLVYEISEEADLERTWTYDAAGNIISSTFVPYWRSEDLEPTEYNYTYGDNEWGDWLTAYNGRVITRDNIGNPLSDGIWNYTWEHGRQLASMTDGTTTWNYTYDVNGMRTQRTNGQTEYTYVYDGGLLSFMTTDDHTLYFTYDAAGKPMTVTLDGTVYYYLTNIQGDVIAILDASGNRVVAYLYDAWGNPVSLTGSLASTLGALNPLRYRGYAYDTETGLYYVSSRYYDPSLGRWISADAFISTGQGFTGNNMFVYCGNNPVNLTDPTGARPILSLSVNTETSEERNQSFDYMRRSAVTNYNGSSNTYNLFQMVMESVWDNLEFSAGVGQGLYGEGNILDAVGFQFGMYGNYAALQLEDGRIRFGQEISQGISISFMGQNFGFNEYIFTENGAQTVYQNDSGFYADETLTIVSIAIYPLVGFSARIGFDVVQFCKDLDSVIN